MSYLDKVKNKTGNTDNGRYIPQSPERAPDSQGYWANDATRHMIMRVMVAWNERAALMTCFNTPPAQAELAAWQDLRLDEVFFGQRRVH